MKRDLRIVALGLLKEGNLSSKEIAKQSGLSYASVLKYKKDLQAEGELEAIESVELSKLAEVAEKELKIFPDKTLSKLKVHEKLDIKLNEAAIVISERIRNLSLSVLEPEDIVELAKALAALQTAFFSKPGTNVAILNNNGEPSGTKLDLFSAIKRD